MAMPRHSTHWPPSTYSSNAAIFTWLRDEVARRTEFWRAVMGVVILAIVLLFPQGLVGGLKALSQRWREART